jgi:hypothetical protein
MEATASLRPGERVKKRLAGALGGPSTVSAQPRNRLDWPDEKWLEVEKGGTGKRHPEEQDIRLHPAFRVARLCRHDGLSNPRLSGMGCRDRLLGANPPVSVEVHGFAREAFGSGLLFDDRPEQGEVVRRSSGDSVTRGAASTNA